MTPWMCLGLVAALIAALRYRRQLPNPVALALLTAFVLLFAGVMTFLPKKFDRYLLPTFPTLDLLAAVGLVWIAGIVSSRVRPSRITLRSSGALGWLLVGLVLAANLTWYHPYELAYYNPLLGGGRAASRAVPVGWGEGYEAVGAYLSSVPDACDVPVAVEFHPLLQPYVCNRLISLDKSDKYPEQHFTVLYRDQIQRNNAARITTQLLTEGTPVHVVRKHGIEYAYIYDVKPPVDNAIDAEWESGLRLRGYDLKTSSVREEGQLTVTWQWEAAAPPPAHVFMFVHLLDAQGERLGQLDLPLAGASGWKPGRVTIWKQQVPAPKDAPPGTYWIALGLYDVRDGQRLPVRVTTPEGTPDDGAHAVFLGPINVR